MKWHTIEKIIVFSKRKLKLTISQLPILLRIGTVYIQESTANPPNLLTQSLKYLSQGVTKPNVVKGRQNHFSLQYSFLFSF